jgi:pantetheine-phosphate adenylyltransferase
MRVCIGGTFDFLHRGHKYLIDTAFSAAGKNGLVFIGIMSGDFAKEKETKNSFLQRKKNVEEYLIKKGYSNRAEIKPIYDKYGLSIDGEFDAIVVSPETLPVAREINKIRAQNGKNPLKILEISFILAKDGKKISSTRIGNREIDADGCVLN